MCDFSEIHAAESVACLNKALGELKGIWEEIGIPEEQRLQRTDAVHMHIKVSSGRLSFSLTWEWRPVHCEIFVIAEPAGHDDLRGAGLEEAFADQYRSMQKGGDQSV